MEEENKSTAYCVHFYFSFLFYFLLSHLYYFDAVSQNKAAHVYTNVQNMMRVQVFVSRVPERWHR